MSSVEIARRLRNERQLERYYENREQICATWRQRYAADPEFRARQRAKYHRNRLKKRFSDMVDPSAYGTGRYFVALAACGVEPDDSGMFIISPDLPANIREAVERVCELDDRLDWKFEGDGQ